GDGDGIEGEPDDLIRPKSRAQDAARVLAFVRDVLLTADYAHANLECVVTGDPATPHPYKPYTLYTHPDALRALTDAGFDGVSLGNNHVFDFLARGVADTLQFVGAAGLDHSGAGMNESQALRSTIHATPGGIELALLGLSDMRYDGGVDRSEYLLVAADPAKPGALHASIANLTAFLTAEAGAFAIPVLHGGAEYTHHPSDAMRELFIAAIRAGAGLVIAHHPHVLHGIGLVDGDRGPRFAVMSLGNFVFDQDMAETIESAIAVVDVERLPDGSHDVARVVLIPVVLDHYVPKLLAGEGLVRLGRKLGHLSTTLPTHAGDPPKQVDGLRGAVVFVSGARIVALRDFAQYRQIEQDEALNLPVRGRATAPLPYPRRLPADFLARVRTDVPATLELGRDVLGVGDFEDHDVDGEVGENPGWVLGSSAFLQSRTVHGGVRAAALRRHRGERAFAPLQTARRVPITGGARVTIRGYVRGHDAGRLTIRARFASDTEVLAERTLTLAARGTYGWTPFSLSAIAPKQARGLHLSFRQGRPDGEAGTIYLDDIAVVQWEREIAHSESGPQLATPNDWSFFRFTDLPFGVDRITATLTHRAYLLR
ncbi:MAG TPA: CapA family protein, partial [Nannocystis sp.]